VNWKLVVAVGAAVGTLVWAAQRRVGRSVTGTDPWADVTDGIAPTP
jgi:hypothetical protein